MLWLASTSSKLPGLGQPEAGVEEGEEDGYTWRGGGKRQDTWGLHKELIFGSGCDHRDGALCHRARHRQPRPQPYFSSGRPPAAPSYLQAPAAATPFLGRINRKPGGISRMAVPRQPRRSHASSRKYPIRACSRSEAQHPLFSRCRVPPSPCVSYNSR